MGKRGEMIRCQKPAADYYAGDYETQLNILREKFTIRGPSTEEERRTMQAMFGVATAALNRRLKRFYNVGNKYREEV